MNLVLLGTILLCLSSGAFCAETAQPAPEPELAGPRLEPALARLGSGRFEEREQAESELKSMGPGVLPALRLAAENNADPEVRLRCARVSAVLEFEDAAEQARRSRGADGLIALADAAKANARFSDAAALYEMALAALPPGASRDLQLKVSKLNQEISDLRHPAPSEFDAAQMGLSGYYDGQVMCLDNDFIWEGAW